MRTALLVTGNIIALLAGLSVGVKYGGIEGLIVWAALAFLVDIRGNTMQPQEARRP